MSSRSRGTLRHLHTVLHSCGSRLARYSRDAHRASIHLQTLIAVVNDRVAAHLVGVRVDDADLTVLVDSPTWAAQLRFRVPDILRSWPADAAVPRPGNIRVRVARPMLPARRGVPARPRTASLSPAAALSLQQASDSTPDPALKSIFARLSRRARKTGGFEPDR